jgi:hypothetical protein
MGSQLSEHGSANEPTIGDAAAHLDFGSWLCASRKRRIHPVSRSLSTVSGETEESVYVGSYFILADFLRDVRTHGSPPLSETRFKQLLGAVEDISRQGSGQSVDHNQLLFKDVTRENFETMLSTMGISYEVDEKAKPEKKTKKPESNTALGKTASFTYQPSAQTNGSVDQCERVAFLNDLRFDRNTVGNIRSDAQVLVDAFCSPSDLVARYAIEKDTLGAWIVAIADQYNAHSYHNWRHAFDVFQFSYMSMNAGNASRFFNYQDVLAIYAAEIAHDVAHTGTNNTFLVKTSHQLALTYNDHSPLENMHANVCFETLRRPGLNFLHHMSEHDFSVFRQKVIDAILATDMSKHFELVDRFSARVAKQEDNPFTVDTKQDRERQKASKGDRRMLMHVFIHVSDLSHCARPWDSHKYLVAALEEEFFLQGDKEKELGIPVMPMMDRSADSLAAGQGFFLDKLVRPLVEPFTHFISDKLPKEVLENLAINKKSWTDLVEKHGKLTASKILSLEGSAREMSPSLP